MMFVQSAIAFSLLLFPNQRPASVDCNFSTQNNAVFETCLAKEVKKAEIDMAYVYQRALEAIEASHGRSDAERSFLRAELVSAQKAWIAYKQAQCNGVVSGQWSGGSGLPQAVFSCELEHLQVRIKELQDSRW